MPSACLIRCCCFSRSGQNSTAACTRGHDSHCSFSRPSPGTTAFAASCQSPLLKTASGNSQMTQRDVLSHPCSCSFSGTRRSNVALAAIRASVWSLCRPVDRHPCTLCEQIGRAHAHPERTTSLVLYFTLKCGSHSGVAAVFAGI